MQWPDCRHMTVVWLLSNSRLSFQFPLQHCRKCEVVVFWFFFPDIFMLSIRDLCIFLQFKVVDVGKLKVENILNVKHQVTNYL